VPGERIGHCSRRCQPRPVVGPVGYALRRAQLAVFADFVAALADLELRPVTFSVLVVIAENDGLSQVAAGEVLGIQRANFVPPASELVKRGLITRAPSAADRRSSALRLTVEGRRLLERAWVPVLADEERITRRLGRGAQARMLALLDNAAGTGFRELPVSVAIQAHASAGRLRYCLTGEPH
jgi:DNA-binding MarR family transcriptional regulator